MMRSIHSLPLWCVLTLAGQAMFLEANGQCANDNVLVGAAITPPCPGSTTAPCVQGGQYALVNVVAGNVYTFSTCGGAAFDTRSRFTTTRVVVAWDTVMMRADFKAP
ncbi:MAG: hypothetical protein IPO12_08585 [Flavobacteriales bacterium]|nr:hypothetical protein [Flavobacteriales bacterium]